MDVVRPAVVLDDVHSPCSTSNGTDPDTGPTICTVLYVLCARELPERWFGKRRMGFDTADGAGLALVLDAWMTGASRRIGCCGVVNVMVLANLQIIIRRIVIKIAVVVGVLAVAAGLFVGGYFLGYSM